LELSFRGKKDLPEADKTMRTDTDPRIVKWSRTFLFLREQYFTVGKVDWLLNSPTTAKTARQMLRAACKNFGDTRSLFNSVTLLSQLQECTKKWRQACVVAFGHVKGH
jgi:hypothetical protein